MSYITTKWRSSTSTSFGRCKYGKVLNTASTFFSNANFSLNLRNVLTCSSGSDNYGSEMVLDFLKLNVHDDDLWIETGSPIEVKDPLK